MNQRITETSERTAALRRAANPDTAADADPAPHPLVALGAQLGNAQVARMLAQREGAPPEEEEEQVQAEHDLAQREGEEEEEQVQAKHDLAQREGAPPEEEEEQVQAKHDLSQREADAATPEVGLEGGPVSDALAGRINGQRGGGSSLDSGTRASMEGSFGTSFEDVRVHTDAESDALNRSISAKAFTTGSDIFFRNDSSPGDQGLLAHELTHVVQQRSGGGGGGMIVGPAGDSHEQQADATSTAVTSGAAAQAQREGNHEG
jgi:hypothetical protein